MERHLNVNAAAEEEAWEPTEDVLEANRDVSEDTFTGSSTPPALGPCLYLGPSGERCGAAAVEDCYCARHVPGAKLLPVNATKALVAGAAVVAILWPIFADLYREILRFIYSR